MTPVDLVQQLEVAQLRHENAQLKDAAADTALHMLRSLVSVTSSIFGNNVSVFEDHDPEFPDDTYTVFAVDSTLPPQEIVDAEQRWIRSLRQIAPGAWTSVRLLIRAQ